MKRLRASMRFATSVLLLVAFVSAPAAAQDLVIRFFNVGQGDAALITSPEGKTALIDGGDNNGYASHDLDQLHIDTLDLVVASHNHADHIGGLWDILRTITVRAYMENGIAATSNAYYDVISMLHAKHVQYLAATPRTIQLGSIALRILPMPSPDKSQNNSSVGVLVTYRGFTALFTGDAEGKERKYWEAHAELPHVAVLKVAHHGSVNGTDPTWVEATQPIVAVISVGANNTYHHPAEKTLSTLERAGVQVYRTDRDGDISVTVDSLGGFTVRAETSEPVRSWPAASASPHSPLEPRGRSGAWPTLQSTDWRAGSPSSSATTALSTRCRGSSSRRVRRRAACSRCPRTGAGSRTGPGPGSMRPKRNDGSSERWRCSRS